MLKKPSAFEETQGDNSRFVAANDLFWRFQLGVQQVIDGWDEGIARRLACSLVRVWKGARFTELPKGFRSAHLSFGILVVLGGLPFGRSFLQMHSPLPTNMFQAEQNL